MAIVDKQQQIGNVAIVRCESHCSVQTDVQADGHVKVSSPFSQLLFGGA